MKKIIPILVVGILVLSGLGVAATTNNMATTMDNQPPGKPTIKGPTTARPGTYEYTFNATDPDGDNVSYFIHWGDGTHEEWTGWYTSGEEIKRKHTYNMGDFVIYAKAKDIYGAEGPEGTLPIEFSRSKQITNPIFIQFLERFIECFPLLEKLLNIQR